MKVFAGLCESHPNGRGVLKKIIKRIEAKCPVEEKANAGRLVWSSVTTAVISRAAKQLARVAQADNPAGIMLGALSWRKRQREPADQCDEIGNMGIYHSQQPSSLFQTQPSHLHTSIEHAVNGSNYKNESEETEGAIEVDADEEGSDEQIMFSSQS